MTKAQEKKIWITRPFDPDLVQRVAEQAKVSYVVAQTLVGRKIDDPQKVAEFLAPPNLARGLHAPAELPGCVEAARFLLQSIKEKRKIVVYGDYDVDGMTATALLLQAIRTLGGDCLYYVPNRLDEGYGLNQEALKRLKDDENADVVVTVDCGITSLEEAKFAKEIGLALVVTDHHTPIVDEETGKQILPDVAAVVHPKILLPNLPPYPFPEICGAFVAFKLAWQLGVEASGGEKTSPEMREFLLQAIGLAALGTIADVVPLLDENRTLVRYALEKSFVDHMPLGLKFLAEIVFPNASKKITSEDVGFMIAPRLNAAGREVLNESLPRDPEDELNWQYGKTLLENPHRLAVAGQMGLASLGVELLITDKADRARELAPFINNLNATRQKLERRIMSDALKMIEEKYADAPAFVLASRDWHPGVIGIVAGRISERFYRPAIMIALREPDANTGSARSVGAFNMYDALDACSEYLTRFGGHAAAAGLGVKESQLEAFREAFCDYVERNFNAADRAPKLYIDGEFPFAAITLQTLNELNKAAPFGAENQRPIFATCGVSLVGQARRVGGGKPKPGAAPGAPLPQGNVFQARFRQHNDERRAVAFSRGEWVDEMNELVAANPQTKFDVAFQVVYNDYLQQVELRLQDWRVAE